jgi:hypothetical protein
MFCKSQFCKIISNKNMKNYSLEVLRIRRQTLYLELREALLKGKYHYS